VARTDVSRETAVTSSEPALPPEPPAAAAEVFGGLLPLAVDYVVWLAGAGVQRGLLGPREVDRIWVRHVLNSAAVAPAIPVDASVVDLGSGAGLPGIPLSLARPDLRMTLLEPLLRRSTFLSEVVADLGLGVRVVRGRGEDLAPAAVDVIVARAVAPLSRLVPLALPALRPGGRLVALKGRSAEREVDAAATALDAAGASSVAVEEYRVAGEDEPTRAVVVVAGRRRVGERQ
jgi:16S rRNA (guanine527-N7)-methyltransferase